MLSERDIELAHPEAFDFVFGNLPAAKRAEFNRHLSGCRYCQAVVDEYSEIGRIIKNLPPHVEPPADLEDRTVAAMVAATRRAEGRAPSAARTPRTRPPPGPTRFPSASLRPSPRPRSSRFPSSGLRPRTRPSLANRPPTSRQPAPSRHGGQADGHSPAGVAAPPRPPGRCRRRRRCDHHRRHRRPAQPSAEAGHPGRHGRHPASCHHGGQGERLRSSHRASDGPSGCLRQLGYHLDRASPQELRGCEVVRMLVRQHQTGQVASAGTFLVPDSGSGTFSMTSAVDPHDFSTMEITIRPPTKTALWQARSFSAARRCRAFTRHAAPAGGLATAFTRLRSCHRALFKVIH